MKGHNYIINGGFARRKRLPVVFQAATLAETAKAVYLYGGASIKYARRAGRCCRCGRLLTHPGSAALGIGPECLGDWGLRDVVLTSLSKEEIEGLNEKLRATQTVDTWIPKGAILNKEDSLEDIFVPSDHPMLKSHVASAEKIGGELKVRFPYDPKKVATIRTIPGRRWDSSKKIWIMPHTALAVKTLKEIGIEAPAPTPRPTIKRSAINLQGFGRQLMPFQREGLKFLHAKDGRALIGDEMGLGKTIQALAYIHTRPDLRPALVICPASLKLNWAQEAAVACPELKTSLISGKTQGRLPTADIHIINYDIVADRFNNIVESDIKLMILDEAHYLKNRKAKRTKAILGKGKKAPGLSRVEKIIALTGTPILNRPVEIYPVAKTLAPNDIPPFMTFAHKYCGAKHNGFGWDFNGSSNTKELHDLLTSTIMIRRTKAEVLKDLPEKTRSVIPIEMSATAVHEYEQAKAHFLKWLATVDPEKVSAAQRAEVLVQFQTLKRLAARGKWAATIDWLKDALNTGSKILVFAIHHDAVDSLMDALKSYIPVKIDGRDSQEARNAAVSRFQDDPACRVFVGNIKAAGVGLTLTAASAVAFTELGWTPGEHIQAEDRAHRIGQKNAVNVYYLIAKDTIEEDIAALLDNKQKVLNAVLDGTGTAQESLLTELLNKYHNKNKKRLTN